MFRLLFRNRWFAVGYVALTLVSASLFVGHGGGVDELARTTKQLQVQRAMLSQPSVAPVVRLPAPHPNVGPTRETLLQSVPGSNADPANPQVGDVFVNPVTGQRVRAVKREDAGKYQPAFPGE
ncbi:MAG: hypothetical protein JWQ16_591 [Novosphingobium sp.]|nr:hypothetical protein [Novosphingobium sp.]